MECALVCGLAKSLQPPPETETDFNDFKRMRAPEDRITVKSVLRRKFLAWQGSVIHHRIFFITDVLK